MVINPGMDITAAIPARTEADIPADTAAVILEDTEADMAEEDMVEADTVEADTEADRSEARNGGKLSWKSQSCSQSLPRSSSSDG